MIIAIMVISVMMLFSSDLILSSQVNLELSVKRRDNLKAEYMAKSGANAAFMLLSADFAYDLFQASQAPQGAKLVDGLGDFWSALNGIPIGGETADMIAMFQEGFDINKVMGADILSQLKLFDGTFAIEVTDESQKVNINYCHTGLCTETLLMLESLFSCPAEKEFLERKKVDPTEMAHKIKDWIDANSKPEPKSGINDEDDPYVDRDPKMKAKNAPMDSLDELLLVDGWDQDLHAVFAPYLTIYPYQPVGKSQTFAKINVNTASRALLGCLFPESKGECTEKSTLALKLRNEDKTNLGGAKSLKETLRDTLCYAADEKGADDKSTWFSEQSSVFRVRSEGSVGDQTKVLEVVVERLMPDPKKEQNNSYQILYWKMI